MKTYQNYINGRSVPSQGDGAIEVLNPATGEVISRVPESTAEDLGMALDAAHDAQPAWAKRPAIERANLLRQISAKLRENVKPLARVIVEEQGKTIGLAEVEVNFTADYIDYMAEWARRIEGEIIPSDRPGESIFLFREPIGVVGGILPWNFPFFLIARKMAPALVCGNAIVIKSSEETPNNAFEFCRLLSETDLPAGLVNILSGRGAGVGQALAESPRIGLISFTGSVATGSRIMASAAKNITKVNLELGGKAPASSTAAKSATAPSAFMFTKKSPPSSPKSSLPRCPRPAAEILSPIPASITVRSSTRSGWRKWRPSFGAPLLKARRSSRAVLGPKSRPAGIFTNPRSSPVAATTWTSSSAKFSAPSHLLFPFPASRRRSLSRTTLNTASPRRFTRATSTQR
jgi:hypothetical protein